MEILIFIYISATAKIYWKNVNYIDFIKYISFVTIKKIQLHLCCINLKKYYVTVRNINKNIEVHFKLI